MPASLILPQGRNGPAFLAFHNFDVLFEWNQSFVYVTTAAYFATRLSGAPVFTVGNPSEGIWWPTTIGFVVYAMLPVALLCVGPTMVPYKALGAGMMALGGIWGYWDVIQDAGEDPDSALVFVLLPVYQLVAAVAFLLLLWFIGRSEDEEESE